MYTLHAGLYSDFIAHLPLATAGTVVAVPVPVAAGIAAPVPVAVSPVCSPLRWHQLKLLQPHQQQQQPEQEQVR